MMPGDKNKPRIVAVLFIVAFVFLLGFLTGCTDSSAERIKGYVVNAHTETVRVDIYRASTSELEDSVSCPPGSNVSLWLPPGKYDIEAYDHDDSFIGSIEFTLSPSADRFYISVFTYKVTANQYTD